MPKVYETKYEKALANSNKQNTVAIYTDGSWANKGDSKIYAGGFLIIESSKIVAREVCSGDDKGLAELRNVAGELQAVVKSIDYVVSKMPHIKTLFIYADYNGVVNWTKPLNKGGWKRKNVYTQDYRRLIDDVRKFLNLEFEHVKGHNDDVFNEEADALASYSRDLAVSESEFCMGYFLDEYSYLEKNPEIVKSLLGGG